MFEKLLYVLKKNFLYALIFVIALVFFVYYAGNVLDWIIAVIAAVLACMCGMILYNKYKTTSMPAKRPVAKKSAPATRPVAKKSAPAKRPAAKKSPATKRK